MYEKTFIALVVVVIILIIAFACVNRERFEPHESPETAKQAVIDHANQQIRAIMALRARPEFAEPLEFAEKPAKFAKLDYLILQNDAIRLELADNPNCDLGLLSRELAGIDGDLYSLQASDRLGVVVVDPHESY